MMVSKKRKEMYTLEEFYYITSNEHQIEENEECYFSFVFHFYPFSFLIHAIDA